MMDQLGIQALRPGPSGDEKAPNHANYDESKANPYRDLPDPLTLNDGRKVATRQMWLSKRHPEIVETYEKYVYGRVPKEVPKVKWSVTSEAAFGSKTAGDIPVDSNELIALCAPRLTFISYGIPEKGDAH